MEGGGSGAPGMNFLIVLNKKSIRKWRGRIRSARDEFPYCLYMDNVGHMLCGRLLVFHGFLLVFRGFSLVFLVFICF